MKSLSFMLVDDSNITIKKLTNMIEELGHRVIFVANTGQHAANEYMAVKPDMVTMDITMPDMDGIEATRRIVAQDKNALIIMITSHGQEQMVIEAIEAGAKGYVLKPVNKDKLKEHIEQVFAKYGA
ncbi:MAG: response regulator [Deltaproteobacteria bacterium]|nr:response regulator [Deltaproteobacteria bacterium]MBF0523890.1 response regulator [Deltaproteobacteria bacterium]